MSEGGVRTQRPKATTLHVGFAFNVCALRMCDRYCVVGRRQWVEVGVRAWRKVIDTNSTRTPFVPQQHKPLRPANDRQTGCMGGEGSVKRPLSTLSTPFALAEFVRARTERNIFCIPFCDSQNACLRLCCAHEYGHQRQIQYRSDLRMRHGTAPDTRRPTDYNK